MRIYGVKLPKSISKKEYNYLVGKICKIKQMQLSKFIKHTDKMRTMFSELLLMNVLYKFTKADDIVVSSGEYGKPFLPYKLNLHYNVSHSGKWVVVGVDKSHIGIDIEEIVQINYGISEKFFSKIEKASLKLASEEDKLSLFYDIWTIKESYIKKIGYGLSKPLCSFSAIIDDVITVEDTDKSNPKCNFNQYCIDENYKLTVCTSGDYFPSSIEVIDYRRIMHEIVIGNYSSINRV